MRLPTGGILDVATAFVCLTIVALLLEQRFTRNTPTEPSSQPVVGERAPDIDGVNYADSKSTLLIVTRSSCTFCEQSASFWRRLLEARDADSVKVRVVTISDEPVEITRTFLARHDLKPDDVVSARLPVLGTPTLIIVNGKGVIRGTWLGRQPTTEAENAVIDALSETDGRSGHSSYW